MVCVLYNMMRVLCRILPVSTAVLLLLLDHSLAVNADDLAWFFADGQLVAYSTHYTQLHEVNIDGSTRILAVIVFNKAGIGRFFLSLSNGVVSDDSWRCVTDRPATNGK